MTIITRLSGGLGNQLFQLSASLYCASKIFKSSLLLDTRFLGAYETSREFDLQFILNHLSGISVYTDGLGIPGWYSKFRLGRLFDKSFGQYAFFNSPSHLLNLKKSSYKLLVLDGYFQIPELTFPQTQRLDLFGSLSQEFSYLRRNLSFFGSVPFVSIHIRRGDFVTSSAASSVFKTISLNYYRDAARSFPSDALFLVFGDDPLITGQFAKEVGGVDIATLGLGLKEEFMLMALCDHNIIANSTFSWWAAHLGDRIGKRVIAPSDWYVNPVRSRSNPLLLPHFELLSTL